MWPQAGRSLTSVGLLLLSGLGAGCATAPAAMPPSRPTARAIAFQAARVLVPYQDPLHTYTVSRPQTWVVLDARSSSRFASALGDGVRFFEPITASDPDAGSSGKLWVDVVPARPGTTPRQVLLAPFVDADYPPALLARMALTRTRLGNAPAYRLLTLAARTQVTLLLARWRDLYYRVIIFSAATPAEVAPVLKSWRFL